MSNFTSEIEEINHLLSIATHQGVKTVLNAHKVKLEKLEHDRLAREAASAANVTTEMTHTSTYSAPVLPKAQYVSIENFAWDQGEYNSPMVSIFIELDGVGTVKDNVEVTFSTHGFDVKVHGLNGKNYRLLKDNLEKDIVPDKSKFIVKNNKIVVKLQKVKGQFSYDQWTSLTAKNKKPQDADAKKDPMGGKK